MPRNEAGSCNPSRRHACSLPISLYCHLSIAPTMPASPSRRPPQRPLFGAPHKPPPVPITFAKAWANRNTIQLKWGSTGKPANKWLALASLWYFSLPKVYRVSAQILYIVVGVGIIVYPLPKKGNSPTKDAVRAHEEQE